MFQKVLVPLDGSKLAEAILPYLTQFAQGLESPLIVMSVVSPDIRGWQQIVGLCQIYKTCAYAVAREPVGQ